VLLDRISSSSRRMMEIMKEVFKIKKINRKIRMRQKQIKKERKAICSKTIREGSLRNKMSKINMN
jgi:hypothetical protein